MKNKMVIKKFNVIIGIFIFLNLILLSVASATICTDIPVIYEKSVIPGETQVILSLTGFTSFPDGTVLEAKIYEKDTLSNDNIRTLSATIDAAGNANIIWIVTQEDLDKTPKDYEQFYFTVGGETSGYLRIIDLTQAYWKDKYGAFIGEGTSSPNITVSTNRIETVFMVLSDPRLFEGLEVTFEVWEDDDLTGDDLIATYATTVTAAQPSKATAIWGINTAEVDALTDDYDKFYFKTYAGSLQKTSNNLKLIKYSPNLGECEEKSITICEQYTTKNSCEFNDCGVSSFGEVESLCGTERIIPEHPLCNYIIDCVCGWNSSTSSCGPKAIERSEEITPECDPNLGECSFSQIPGDDNCDDGFLNYAWAANFNWKDNNYSEEVPGTELGDDGYWHYPSPLKESCIGGEKEIPCPTALALPFFGVLELAATLIAIALVYYFIFIFRKRTKSKSNKSLPKAKRNKRTKSKRK